MKKNDRYKRKDKYHLKEFLFKAENGKDLYFFNNMGKKFKDNKKNNDWYMGIIDLEKAHCKDEKLL